MTLKFIFGDADLAQFDEYVGNIEKWDLPAHWRFRTLLMTDIKQDSF